MMRKRAETGTNAAILIAIIALLIILYIVFLPAAQREKLLEDKTAETSSSSTSQENPNVILREFPGTLSASSRLEWQKNIPDAFLLETTSAKELKRVNPFIVRNGWLDKKTYKFDFELDDPENTDNILLTFTAKKMQGILAIKLNDNVIFESELESSSPEPVKLDKKQLSKSNTLEFSVSSVGARFWTTNEYTFENMRIIGDITDKSRQESANIFTLTDSEFKSMEKATLRFVPYCSSVNDLGLLEIFVNSKRVFSTAPACDSVYRQSIPKSSLNEGENNVVFRTTKGSYSVEQINIALEFKEPVLKTYYFEISKDNMDRIKNSQKDLQLAVKFADSNSRKRVKLNINGHLEAIETDKAAFTKNIESKSSEGNNFVRLEPLEDVEVVELRVELV